MTDFLFNLAGKLVWAVIEPQSWVLAGLIATLWCLWRSRHRAAAGWVTGTLGLYLVVAVSPLADVVLSSLEDRYSPPPVLAGAQGLVVLGGGEDARLSLATGQVQLKAGGERVVAAAVLAREWPDLQLVLTGGDALRTAAPDRSGATVMATLLADLGVDPTRFLLEHLSRNTSENARFSASLVDPTERWVLVTSAFHMPRAMASFERAGWTDVIPYPVDYRAEAARLHWDFLEQGEKLNLALKEYIGLAAYAAFGR